MQVSNLCTMPERRSKDRKDTLLVVSGIFLTAALLSLLSAFQLTQTTYWVFPAVFALFCITASAITFWAWWDVSHGGR
jgi:hypothetical protein